MVLRYSIQRPHVHGNGPVGFDHPFPDGGQNDLAIGTDEVVMAFLYAWPDNFHIQEGLLDEVFHTLNRSVSGHD